MSESILNDVKVVEFATMVSGPYCGKLLADLGAEVVKVESLDGDPARKEGPFPETGPHPEKSALFLYLNTSKKGVVLDLKKADDLESFKKTAGNILRELRSSKKMPGQERIYTAGEKEYLVWLDRQEKGAPLNKKLQGQILEIQKELNLTGYDFPFD